MLVAPVRFAFWPARPDIVRDNVRQFEARSGVAVEPIEVPDADYTRVLQARLRDGSVDVFYAQRGEAAHWNAQGLIEHLDDHAAIAGLVSQMTPPIRESSFDMGGRLLGLTYYNAGPFALFRNEPLLAVAGFAGTAEPSSYPGSWDALTAQAREIKQAGFSDAPILPRWHRTQTGLIWSLIAQAWSAGERFIDGRGNPVFGADTPIAETLELWRQWWMEGLVPREAIAWRGDAGGIEAWRTGRHAWTFSIDYLPAVFAEPPVDAPITHVSPRIPGPSNTAAIPGHALLCLSRRARAPAERDAALELMRFLGGEGLGLDFFVPRRWMLEMNLPQPFAHLTDERTRATMRKNFNPALADCAVRWLLESRAHSEVPLLVRMPCFSDWSDRADAIVGTRMLAQGISVRDTVASLRIAWERLRSAELTIA
jgi:multiple sugar transport system substrate-binding protein